MNDDISRPHPPDSLHGITLAMMLDQLVAHFGWDELSRIIQIRCFIFDPSLKSSLQFLRRTPWARAKVEALYRQFLSEKDLPGPPVSGA